MLYFWSRQETALETILCCEARTCVRSERSIPSNLQATPLSYGTPVVQQETAFEYEYYELPPVTHAMLTHSVEVRFSASFSSRTYGTWTAARPELLLHKVNRNPL